MELKALEKAEKMILLDKFQKDLEAKNKPLMAHQMKISISKILAAANIKKNQNEKLN